MPRYEHIFSSALHDAAKEGPEWTRNCISCDPRKPKFRLLSATLGAFTGSLILPAIASGTIRQLRYGGNGVGGER